MNVYNPCIGCEYYNQPYWSVVSPCKSCPKQQNYTGNYVVTTTTVPIEYMTKHGKWILAEDGDGVVCSCCGKDFCILVYETDDFKYCPNCGTLMDLED